MTERPRPPAELLDAMAGPMFVPSPELLEWVTSTFFDEAGPLFNEDHQHLIAARLGFLWTNVPNARGGRRIIGQAEFRPPGGTMGKWARARAQAQLYGWFGGELDFLITIDADYAATADDTAFCALIEHELFHCGQQQDEFGMPKFSDSSGMPVFTMRGHDLEEFLGVVKRYGAYSEQLQEFAAAASDHPEIDTSFIARACGSCR